MRVILLLLFLTLVVSFRFSSAAPTTTTTIQSSPLSGADDDYLGTFRPKDLPIHPSFQLSLFTGYQGGHFIESYEYAKGPLLGLRFAPLKKDRVVWDYEVQYITGEQILGLGFGRRWNCCEKDPYQPYGRLAINTFLESDDELSGLIEIRRWRARAGLGVGETFFAEGGAGLAVTGTDLYLLFGYNAIF